MDVKTVYEVLPIHGLMVSILVLYLGLYLNRKFRVLMPGDVGAVGRVLGGDAGAPG